MRWAWLGGDRKRERAERIFSAIPQLQVVPISDSQWESLLVRDDYDLVFVAPAADPNSQMDQLKKLVAGGTPVAMLYPAVDVLSAYEIEAVRREVDGKIVAVEAHWLQPAWLDLFQLVHSSHMADESSPLGTAEYIAFESYFAPSSTQSTWDRFLNDLPIMRRLLGEVTSVNAVGDSTDPRTTPPNSLVVHCTARRSITATWTLIPTQTTPETRVRVVGTRDTVTLVVPEDSSPARWEFLNNKSYAPRPAPWLFSESFRNWLQSGAYDPIALPPWPETCLDLEVADSAEKSLRRKRTIDLFTTNRSEEKTFKGFMAATGCLILMAIFFGFVVLAVWDGFRSPFREADGIENRPEGENPAWPLWLRLWPVYPLIIFLLMQLLIIVARRPSSTDTSVAGSKPSSHKDSHS